MMQATPTYPLEMDHRPPAAPLLGLSLWFGLALVGLTVANTAFNDGPAGECLWGLLHVMRAMFAALLLASLIKLRRPRSTGSSALAPLLVNLFTLAVILLIPSYARRQHLSFQMQQYRYATVIDWVETGALRPDDRGWASLPAGYQQLTSDGRIQVVRDGGVTRVLFPRDRGLNRTNYLVYRADGYLPAATEFGLIWLRLEQIAPNWYAGAARLPTAG